MGSSGGSTFSGTVTSSQVTDFDPAVNSLIDVHEVDDDASHGAAAGISKICIMRAENGLAQNLWVAESSTLPTGEFVGDVVIVVPDGFFV